MATPHEPYGNTPLTSESLAALGHPLSITDFNVDDQGRLWRIVRGQKTYYAPEWFDPQTGVYAGTDTPAAKAKTGQGGSLFTMPSKYDWTTGEWKNPIDWKNVIGFSAAGAVGGGAAASLGAFGGTGGAVTPGASTSATTGADVAADTSGAFGPYASGYAGYGLPGATGSTIPTALAPVGGTMPTTWQTVMQGFSGQGPYSWLGPVANAGLGIWGVNTQANATADAAQKQLDATKYATDAQSKAEAEKLAFLRQQAQYDATSAEVNRQANYDQWAAKQEMLGTVGQALGLPNRRIPQYVPMSAYPGADTWPTFGGSSSGSSSGGGPGNTTSEADVRSQVAAYFQSRGVTPNPTSVDYWAQKWGEFGRNDPAYFNKRLAQADEFRGQPGPLPTIGAPAPAVSTPPAAQTPPPGNRYQPLATGIPNPEGPYGYTGQPLPSGINPTDPNWYYEQYGPDAFRLGNVGAYV
jgi:hypothetical protein